MSKDIRPHAMTIVTTGANHGLLFKDKPPALAAYRSLQLRGRAYWAYLLELDGRSTKDGAVHLELKGIKAVDPLLEIEDDFGVLCTIDVRELKSFRIADVGSEHDGSGELKLAEVRAAVRFENYVKEEHADLYNMRARGPGSLWTPGGQRPGN